MIGVITALAFVVCCSGANNPSLWGSRIVATASGPSNPMNYQFNNEFGIAVFQNSISSGLSVKDGKCFLNKTQFWGNPCNMTVGSAVITVANVTAQESLITYENKDGSAIITSTTFFIPGCNFSPPELDEVDVKTSFPLSRFVKDLESFKVDFAVQGANSNSTVEFAIDGEHLCTWNGVELTEKKCSSCVELKKDVKLDLRIFHGVFPRKANISRENFAFSANSTGVIVSVDYTQSGVSSEVAECNQSLKTFSFTSATVSLSIMALLWK